MPWHPELQRGYCCQQGKGGDLSPLDRSFKAHLGAGSGSGLPSSRETWTWLEWAQWRATKMIKVLRYLLYIERLGKLGLLSLERESSVTNELSTSINTWWQSRKKMQMDSCKWCLVTGKEAMSTKKTQMKFQLNTVKIFSFIKSGQTLEEPT